MRSIHSLPILAGLVALVVAAPQFFHAESKSTKPRSPQSEAALMRRSLRDSILRSRVEKPMVDAYFGGDYRKALDGFMDKDAGGDHSWQIAMCRLRLGEAREGLRSFVRTRTINPEDYYHLRVALAVAARDEGALQEALEHGAQLRMLSYDDTPVHDLPTFNRRLEARLPLDEAATAKNLMRVACAFGQKYDYETMHLVGAEALRRGATDLSSLLDYSGQCQSTGDLRLALSLAQRAEAEARVSGKGHDLLIAHGRVYDLKNLIDQWSKVRPIAAEEDHLHEVSKGFNRRLWINDEVLKTPAPPAPAP